MNHCDKLYFCNLEPLEVRRLHKDVIMLHKILHCHVSVNMNIYISLSQTNYIPEVIYINLTNFELNLM